MRRNVCGTAQVRPQSSRAARNSPSAVALIPHTLGITLGRRSEDVALGAAVRGARRQLLDEPVGKVQPPIGGFALRAAKIDASAIKVDVLPPNATRFVDPCPCSRQERDEICRRTPLASCARIQPWLASRMKCCLDDVVSFAACHCSSVVAHL